MEHSAFVTGANRGIGFEICRQLGRLGYRVLVGARDPQSGEEAAAKLRAEGFDAEPEHLDVGDSASISGCLGRLRSRRESLGIWINNAGVYPQGSLLEISPETLGQTLQINTLGAAWCAMAVVPLMIEQGYGRIVNVSSGYGSFAEGLEGPAAYSVSKAALNAVTVKLAEAVPATIKVNAACPGWVRTRMGGPDADRSVEEGADTPVWLATLDDDGPSGGFFRNRKPIDW
ncbi:MAG: SDR family oxidoreductase [Xanthomonadales bacterium]|nr:SDR family oxidoreductase [Xanthomonadales bacterium]